MGQLQYRPGVIKKVNQGSGCDGGGDDDYVQWQPSKASFPPLFVYQHKKT